MAGDEAGPDAPSVGCPCDSWCGGANDYAGCLASNPGGALELLAPDTFVEMPEGSDLRCLNGGARLWFNYSTCSSPPCNSKNPDVPIFGNAKCECVDEWAGVDCGLCTADGQCGADSCNRYIHPFASTITAELIEFGHRVIGPLVENALAAFFGADNRGDISSGYISFGGEGTIEARLSIAVTSPVGDNIRSSDFLLLSANDCTFAVDECPAWSSNILSSPNIFTEANATNTTSGAPACLSWSCPDPDWSCPQNGQPYSADDSLRNVYCGFALSLARPPTQILCPYYSYSEFPDFDGNYQCVIKVDNGALQLVFDVKSGNCGIERYAFEPEEAVQLPEVETLPVATVLAITATIPVVALVACFIWVWVQPRPSLEEFDASLHVGKIGSTAAMRQAVPAGPGNPESAGPDSSYDTVLTWENISVDIRDERKCCASRSRPILRDVSGFAGPGILAIVGHSGSGKTSLLEVLSGRFRSKGGCTTQARTELLVGQVALNGKVVTSADNRAEQKGQEYDAGYVFQHPALDETLTAWETMMLEARLRRWSEPTITLRELVKELLDTVSLLPHMHTFVGGVFRRGLSGGQKKRLAIAIELLRRPSVLFLDEPTGGLDSAAAESLMKTLQLVAARGKIPIITTLHQPSTKLYQRIDSTLVLAMGRSVYFGPARLALPYFAVGVGHPVPDGAFNPAEFVVGVSTEYQQQQQASSRAFNLQANNTTQILDLASAFRRSIFWEACDRALGIAKQKPGLDKLFDAMKASSYVSAFDIAMAAFPSKTDDTRATGKNEHEDTGGHMETTPQQAAQDLVEAMAVLHSDDGRGGLLMVPAQETGESLGWGTIHHFHDDGCSAPRRNCAHCGVFAWRHLTVGFRDVSMLLLNFGAVLLMAIVLGLLYMDADLTIAGLLDRQGLFLLSAAFFFFIAQASMALSATERVRHIRAQAGQRNMSLYSPTVYILAKVVFEVLPMRVFSVCMYCLITWKMVGLRSDNADGLGYFVLILVLVAILSSLFFVFLGMTVGSPIGAQLIGSFVALIAMIFSGYLLQPSTLPSGVEVATRFLSFLRPAFEAMCINEFEGARIEITYEGVTVNISGEVILEQLGVDSSAWFLDMISLGAWCLVFLIMAIVTMAVGMR
eukprot:INCI7170.9.p1 GENE.INCI7170.9~~INCI7170.9.p1  ORF type:complete len:1193 (-),score=152.46 INCI7170.9:148-3531(-)